MVRCSSCGQGFGRQEHLIRHMRIHTREKPYQCNICEKRFSRLDVLNRHTASHEEPEAHAATATSSRACKKCANDRVRCSRGQPCSRCSDRGTQCQYPTTRRPRSQANRIGGDNDGQEGNSLANPIGAQQPEAGFDTRSASVDQTAVAASFACAIDSSMTGEPPWLNGIVGVENLYNYDPPVLGLTDVNWMSPHYQQTVDWDALMAGPSNNNDAIRNDTHILNGTPGSESNSRSMHQQHAHPHLDAAQSRSVVDSVASSSSTQGRYYVDSAGARAPFGGRSHNREVIGGAQAMQPDETDRANSSMSCEISGADSLCPSMLYDNFVEGIVASDSLASLNIDLTRLPTCAQLQLYVRHYFENFHPIFPFLRKSSFVEDALQEPLLLLAASVIGSRYLRRLQGREPGEILSHILSTILRRCKYGYDQQIDNERDSDVFSPGYLPNERECPSLSMLQAGILNLFCMLHSGKKSAVESAFVERHYLVEACNSLGLLAQSVVGDAIQPTANAEPTDLVRRWLLRESKIRTGMMIWFLDSTMLYEFGKTPLMQLNDIKAILPSQEAVWENPSLVQQGKISYSDVTLFRAMEIIYMEKRLPPNLGEFSICILVLAIYRNTEQILSREKIRLNAWTPRATAENCEEQTDIEQNWLPPTSTASQWRNSACDCLDVLHWPANSKAARLLGSEHHTILQLHLARLIVLTPTVYIQSFAKELSSASHTIVGSHTPTRYTTARNQILQWVIRDRFKARLSIIHCGALYWHVRRYSCDSVLEPYAVYIATLVLWAFCIMMQLPEVSEAATVDCADEPDPSFLHLDRPLDDELVQTFVRLGHKMSAYISKVGNIQDRDAPAKILQEGISLLNRAPNNTCSGEHGPPPLLDHPCFTWGIEESYIKSLCKTMHATTAMQGSDGFRNDHTMISTMQAARAEVLP
ncbi:hypothetical protein BS50DRAFT_508317 [Corynespora cassiicola Philippines]|uniref:Uncharacterized protein n=1 Tax=Corynespora cassiicola Philippines TaxID=1448308 RepID=A0A2T2N247_CORCC|nr:hypothetical protein BS50DRAFT_508317 [Corynespora cassiicola Philippines]